MNRSEIFRDVRASVWLFVFMVLVGCAWWAILFKQQQKNVATQPTNEFAASEAPTNWQERWRKAHTSSNAKISQPISEEPPDINSDLVSQIISDRDRWIDRPTFQIIERVRP